MGLDVGVLRIEFSPRPEGVFREFAWHLLTDEPDESPFMSGPGQLWSLFTRKQTMRARGEFAEANGLEPDGVSALDAWINSLPWGYCDSPDSSDSDDPEDSIGVELYFNY